jgi:integrase
MATPQHLQAFATDLRLQGYSDLTIKEYVRIMGAVGYEEPTLKGAKAWCAERRQTVSLSTLHRNICVLKCHSKWWADENGVSDPLERLEFPKVPKAKPGRIASQSEVDKMLEAIGPYNTDNEDRRNLRDHAILSTFLYTGMRRAELTRLQVEDVDLEAGRITIRPGKNGEGRIVPVHPKLATSLHRYYKRDRMHRDDAPEYFLGRKGALHPDTITDIFNRVNALAGTQVTSHQLRRKLARDWVKGGGADDALMMLAGWRSVTMPARYRAEQAHELALDQYQRIMVGADAIAPVKRGPIKRKQ